MVSVNLENAYAGIIPCFREIKCLSYDKKAAESGIS